MDIKSQQDLEKLIKLLRKTGVESFKFGEIELKLRSEEPRSKYLRKKRPVEVDDGFPKDNPQFSEEEVLMWSSTPPGLQDKVDN